MLRTVGCWTHNDTALALVQGLFTGWYASMLAVPPQAAGPRHGRHGRPPSEGLAVRPRSRQAL